MGTVVAPAGSQSPFEAPRPRPFRISVELYDRMADSGVFGDRSPIYLWKGQLLEPMPRGLGHSFSLVTLNQMLIRLVPDGWHARQGSPTRILDDSEPEPDMTVVRGSIRDYASRHPYARDVALVIEVADSSRTFDLGEKLEGYAVASIPEYWVVNLREACVEVFTGPTGPSDSPGFERRQVFRAGDEVPIVLNGREVARIAADEILP